MTFLNFLNTTEIVTSSKSLMRYSLNFNSFLLLRPTVRGNNSKHRTSLLSSKIFQIVMDNNRHFLPPLLLVTLLQHDISGGIDDIFRFCHGRSFMNFRQYWTVHMSALLELWLLFLGNLCCFAYRGWLKSGQLIRHDWIL